MKASITGSSGFIGGALNKRLLSMGWETYPTVRSDVDYLFLFGSPSSNDWFKYAQSYSIRETIENFLNATDFCQEHNIKLIYPSSGTVHDLQTPYSKCKKILEILASIYENTLGLRIFAGYGVGEDHKKEYASTIYKFIKDMKRGNSPVIWGDGNQTRDWIYIDDIIDNIIRVKDETGVIDIGTGINHSMNDIVGLINKKLHSKIKPKYIPKPNLYIENTYCKNPCPHKVSLEEGIEKVIRSL